MIDEENSFLEYLQLQGSNPELVTKSELVAAVRDRGYSLSDRQLTFYVSEGLIPKSVRVGSRAGAYPRIVIELLAWVLRAKEGGLSVDAIRELLPVWKYLIRARHSMRLDLAELEYIARQNVTSIEGSYAIPPVVADVLHAFCAICRADLVVVLKDGTEKRLGDTSTTVGFAIARRSDKESGEMDASWLARTRITFAGVTKVDTDPSTVILGLKPNEAVPPDISEPDGTYSDDSPDPHRREEVSGHF